MPRIDPLQLLTCLGVLLKPNGGIKGKEEVAKLASLMSKFSKKLVSKCIYVQILKVTDPILLDMFMASGGWNLTHMWLSDAVEVHNWPLIKELVDLLITCPVTVDRLRENTNAKILKGLSKDAEDECVREKAAELVGRWTQVIREETMHTQDSDKNMVKPVSDDKDISSNNTEMCDSANVGASECNVVERSKKLKRKNTVKKVRKRTKRMMNLRGDTDEDEKDEEKCEKENEDSKSGVSDDIRVSEETRSQWKSLPPEMRALPVYKIMIRDGKQVLAKVTTGFRAAMKAEGSETKEEDVPVKAEPITGDSETSKDSSVSDTKSLELKTVKAESNLETVVDKTDVCVKKESDSESDAGKLATKNDGVNDKQTALRKTRGRTSKLKNKSFEEALKNLENLSSEDSSVLSDRESGKQHSGSSSSIRSEKSDHKSKSKHKDGRRHSSSSKHESKHKDRDGLKRSKSKDGEREGKHREHDKTKEIGKDKDKGSSKSSHDKLKEKEEHKKNKSTSVSSKDKPGKDHKNLELSAKDKETLESLKLSSNSISSIGKIPKKPKITEDGSSAITKPTGPPPPPKEKSFSILENRPKTKTVKTFNSKFRLTGLEEEIQPPPPRVPRKPLPPPEKRAAETSPVIPNLKPKVPVPLKRSSPPPADSVPSEKRIKSTFEELEKTAEDAKRNEKPGGIKVIAPKPKPGFLQESASFMDALTAGSRVEPRKRKRRNSSSRDAPDVKKEAAPTTPVSTSPPTTPTKSPPPEPPIISPSVVKPTFRFYQDTLETAEEEKKASEEKKEIEESEEKKVEEEKNETGESVVEEAAEQSVANEKDEVQKEQPGEENESRTPTPPAEEETASPKQEVVEPPEVRQPVYTTFRRKDGTPVQSVLVYHRGTNYKKKSVKWKEESTLEQVFLFELDETERTNVSRTFIDMKHLERFHEAQAFQLARKMGHEDSMEEKTAWQMLIPITLDNVPQVEIGRNSVERDIQYAREKNVLPAIYYSRTMIPDFPAEADPEHHQMTDPVTIPLDDVTGNPESINDHRSIPWPEPKIAPPRPPSPPGPHGFLGPPHMLGGPGMMEPIMNPMMNMGHGGLLGPGPLPGHGPGIIGAPLGGPVGMGGPPLMGGDWRAGDGTVYTGLPNSMADPFLGGPPHPGPPHGGPIHGGPPHGLPPHGMGMPDGGMPFPHDNGPDRFMDEGMMGPDEGMFMGPEEFPPGGPGGMPFHFRGGPPHGMGGGGRGPRGMGIRPGNRGGPPRGGGFRGGPNRGGRGGQWQGNRGHPHPGGRDRDRDRERDRDRDRGSGTKGNRGICKHFRGGFCRSGDNCPYLHQSAQMY